MSLWRQINRGLRVLIDRRSADRELDEEVQHYLDEATDAYVARGLSPAEARRAARLEIGNAIGVREQVREHGWEHVFSTALGDVRFAGRMLRKSPVFTAVVIAVISLGSGAVTTIFSAMNALVLRPIPGIATERLVTLQPVRPDGSAAEQGSYNYYTYLRERARTMDGIAAWGRVSLTIASDGQGTAVPGNMVTGNYFDLLGVRPSIGRFFSAHEARTPGSQPVIVVSHAFWRSQLGGDPTAIGRMLRVNGTRFTLIGVAPAEFRGIYTGLRTDAWVPVTMQPLLRPRSNLTTASWLWVFGRVGESSSRRVSQEKLSALTAAYAREMAGPAKPPVFQSIKVVPLTGFPNGESGPLLGFVGLLLGAATLVLFIAGVNVAAMLSARYLSRTREMAVRAALGAGRLRLLRQLLTEVLALFLLGAIGGFLVALIATSALEQLPLPANVPVSLELSPDYRVLAFGLGVSLVAGLIFGLAPALRAARKDVTGPLRDDLPGTGERRTFLSRTLIVGQLATSLVLLVAAGLFLRALDHGRQIDPGFDPSGVVTAQLEPESWGYDSVRAREFYRTLRERIEGLPGVAAVSYAGRLPLMMGSSPDEMVVADTEVPIHTASVDAGYFELMRLPLVAGREFTRSDDERAVHVAIVNETLARRVWPGGNPLGRAFRFRGSVTTIVGVARDAKYASLDEATPSFVYFPLAQVWQPTQVLLVRAAAGEEQLTGTIQGAVVSIDPHLPRPRTTTLRQATAIVLLPHRVAAIVTGVLGGAGLILAAVGLYGIMAFSAGRRTREIGIRVALGAGRSTVLWMVIREGVQLAAGGILTGLALSALASRLIAGWLFGVSAVDGVTFVRMSAIFCAVALLASYLPARRAASVDPLTALRAE